MTDIVDAVTRSRMMSGIRGKHTQPEMAVRRYLHLSGYRFRLHKKDLPGRPDLVLPKFKLVIFVHGCFWHRHAGCFYATNPAARKEFWRSKLEGNAERDAMNVALLLALGWRVMIVWECGLKHLVDSMGGILSYIESDDIFMEWPMSPPRARVSM